MPPPAATAELAAPESRDQADYRDLIPESVTRRGGRVMDAFIATVDGATCAEAAEIAGCTAKSMSRLRSQDDWRGALREIGARKAETALAAALQEAPNRNRRALSQARDAADLIDAIVEEFAERDDRGRITALKEVVVGYTKDGDPLYAKLAPKDLNSLVSAGLSNHRRERSATGQELAERLQVAQAGKQTGPQVAVICGGTGMVSARELVGGQAAIEVE